MPELLDRMDGLGISADITVSGVERALPPGVDLAAYRIVDRALQIHRAVLLGVVGVDRKASVEGADIERIALAEHAGA